MWSYQSFFFLVFWWFCKWNQSTFPPRYLLKVFLYNYRYIKNNHPLSKTNSKIFYSISCFYHIRFTHVWPINTIISTGRILFTERTLAAKSPRQNMAFNSTYIWHLNKRCHCIKDGSPLSKSSVFILNYFERIQGIYSIIITEIYIYICI